MVGGRDMKIKKIAEDRIIDIVVYGVMLVAALITIIPFANVIAKAFSANWAVTAGRVSIWPIGFNLDSFKYVFSENSFWHSMFVSVCVTVVATASGILITAVTAYPLSKKHLPGIKIILFLFVFTMLFNGGMIPDYLNMKRLGLINTFPVLILPGLLSVYNMLIIKNYYESLPESIEESAKIDGASNPRIFFTIIAPLSIPVLATIILFILVSFWNSYIPPMMYTTDPNLKTLQLYIRDLIAEATTNTSSGGMTNQNWENISSEGMRSATIVISVVPMLIIYPFLQKYFLKGILIGSVKG